LKLNSNAISYKERKGRWGVHH